MRTQVNRTTASWRIHGAALGVPRFSVVRSSRCIRQLPGSIRCAAASFASPASPLQPSEEGQAPEEPVKPRAFASFLPVSPAQRTLSAIPLLLLAPAALAGIGAAAYAVSIVARSLPVEPAAKMVVSYVAAGVATAAAAAAAAKGKKLRDSAAVIDLYNLLVTLDEPEELTADMVKTIGDKYGINLQKDERDGLRKLYGQMLEFLIPKGDKELQGDEAGKARAFKDALGLSDEDVAAVHIDVAQRLFRYMEGTKKRQAKFEQRKAFQRVIYVSQIVLGDQQAAMLLPWRETFNLTDAQLFVARQNNANGIFKTFLDSRGGLIPADRQFLHELREKQQAVRMLDEAAEDMVKAYTRKHVEGLLTKALVCMRASGKNKNIPGAVAIIRQVLDYSRQLTQLGKDGELVPGLGQVSLSGGAWADGAKLRDIKELYRMYLDEEVARLGGFSFELERDSTDLQAVLALRPGDAQALQDLVAAQIYKKLLREAVESKRLETAESPAKVLQELCQAARFSPEGALEFNTTQYKTKMATLMAKGRLTDDDMAELKKTQRMLCITTDVANKVMRDTAGKALEQALVDIFEGGAKPVLEQEFQRIDTLMANYQLDSAVATELVSKAAKVQMQAYVGAAQKANDRAGVAAPLKQLVQFNALVVTPLLERVKGTSKALKELAEILKQAKAADDAPPAAPDAAATSTSYDPVSEARKVMQARRGEYGEEEKKGQKEVTLREVVTPEMRAELYKTYLMQTMTGDVVDLPVGGVVRKKGNEAARQTEMARLQSLSDILGMNQMEVAQVHQGLGEQAYKQQASDALRSGPMGPSTMQYLEEMRQQLSLPKESADKILKQVRTEVYGTNMSPEDGSRWTVERLQAMAKSGTKADTLMEEPSRRNLFRREVELRMLDGSGDVDAEYILQTLPELLVLKESKVRMTLKELAGSRKRRELVQAVSQLRQKRPANVVTSLQNLLSCHKVLPDDSPMEWKEREELKNVYSLYCSKEPSTAKQVMLQRILGLTDAELEDAAASPAAAVRALVTMGAAGGGGQHAEEEESLF